MDNENNAKAQEIRWETVKTDEEEYLDKLRKPICYASLGSRLPFTWQCYRVEAHPCDGCFPEAIQGDQ
jgi:hypothetical protein